MFFSMAFNHDGIVSPKKLYKFLIFFFSSESSLTPFGKTIAMILVFYSGGKVQSEKEKSPGLILEFKSKSQPVIESKRLYLLQKLHTSRNQFDGNGFFLINYATLVGVCSAAM